MEIVGEGGLQSIFLFAISTRVSGNVPRNTPIEIRCSSRGIERSCKIDPRERAILVASQHASPCANVCVETHTEKLIALVR